MEPYVGHVGEIWDGLSRYEDVGVGNRRRFEAGMETLRLMYPLDFHATKLYIIGSWGLGNAWPLGDIDTVFAPETPEEARTLRAMWLEHKDPAITEYVNTLSHELGIRIAHSFGLKPEIGYDVSEQMVIGRPEGVSLRKKQRYNEETAGYELLDLPLERQRGSYLKNGKRIWLYA